MIISCPSCNTRYRAAGEPTWSVGHARCSRCENVFPLDRPSKTYLLVGQSIAGSPAMTIGMDDPTLAGQLQQTALDGRAADPAAMTYRIQADPDPGSGEKARGAPRRRRVHPVLLTALGATAGWGLAQWMQIIPWGATLAGAGLGLLVSQLGRKWSRAES